MRTTRALLLGLSATSAVGVIVLIHAGVLPRGVRGEWEWPRQTLPPLPIDALLAALGILAFAIFAAVGMHRLRGEPGRGREARWLGVLLVASVLVQVVAHSGAPTGYGLTKWVTLYLKNSSGYFTVATTQMRDPMRFWADYPAWIKRQNPFHIGTHPPGLFLASRALLGAMEADPGLARRVDEHLPESVAEGFASIIGPTPRAERTAVAIMGALTLLACAGTVVPLYWLARAELPAASSWAVATLWPLVPSAVLFHPTADTAFPLLAASAFAFAAWGGVGRAVVSGAILGLGMQFSLVFLPAGLAVAIIERWRDRADVRRGVELILATGAGFLAVTALLWTASGANPLEIWWWNQKNHARFYHAYPRSYLAWIVANPVEMAVAIGLPAAIFAAVGYASREAPRSAWTGLIVLMVLNLSGKNLSEVARLWLPFMPTILVAAGAGIAKVGGGPRTLGAIVFLLGIQTLALEATLQVVYPI